MKRIIYLDYLRVFAIIGVILIHLSAPIVIECPQNIFPYFLNYISRFAVPVFVMISGVLFLKKNVDIKTLYKKYIFKYLLIIIIFFIINAFLSKFAHISFPLYHIWYLFMIIGIYMIYPILKIIILNDKILNYFIILSLGFVFLFPLFFDLLHYLNITKLDYFYNSLNKDMEMFLPLGFSVYFLLGYKIQNNTLKHYKKFVCIIGIFVFIIGLYLTYIFSLKNHKYFGYFLGYNNLLIFLYTIAVFCFFKYSEIFNKENKIINFLSKYTFSIYLFHLIFISLTNKIFQVFIIDNTKNIVIILQLVLVFLLSLIFSIIIKKIPIINKYFV